MVAAIISAFLVTRQLSRPAALDRLLVQASSEMNKNLPMMLDQNTRLDTTHPEPDKTLVYRYTLVNTKIAALDKVKFVESMRPMIVAHYRTNDTMKAFRDGGVTMKYRYSDQQGNFITEIVVHPRDF